MIVLTAILASARACERPAAALSPPADSPHIHRRWPNPPQKAPKEQRPGAPHARQGPRVRSTRRRRRRSPTFSIPASSAEPRASAREPADFPICSRRRRRPGSGARISPPRTGRASPRKSRTGFSEAAQSDYTGSPITRLDPALAKELGLGDEASDDLLHLPPWGRSAREARREGGEQPTPRHPPPPTLPLKGGGRKPEKAAPEAERIPARRRSQVPPAARDLPTGPGGLASMGVAATASRSTDCCAKAGRNSPRQRVGCRTGRRGRRNPKAAAARHQIRLRAEGRPAAGDRRPGRGRAAQRPHPGAARRHRLGQDLHHGQGDRGDAAAGADPGAEQDAGGAALRRVQEVLPRQRGRVFRQLLRLLPAGSLRPAHRHLYREGILDQRADRPHAPFGDARAARARRRHHRRLGVLHLRHRLGRDLFGDDVHAQARRADRPAPAARRSGRAAIQAHRRRFLPRLVPRARRHRRDFPGALRGPRLAGAAVRRRGREASTNSIRSPGKRPTSWNSSRSTPTRIT